jgi:hypothetical protein
MSLAKKLIPLLDRVLVEKIVPPAKSVGGVLLPESATQKVKRGETCPTNHSLFNVLHSLTPHNQAYRYFKDLLSQLVKVDTLIMVRLSQYLSSQVIKYCYLSMVVCQSSWMTKSK